MKMIRTNINSGIRHFLGYWSKRADSRHSAHPSNGTRFMKMVSMNGGINR